MISISQKENCCGCEACVQICPKGCINFQQDSEGFYYPIVDTNYCIRCGLCEKACPKLNSFERKVPQLVFAAQNKNEEVRLNSSSGGIFIVIARYIITQKGGVVFGARFDNQWNVIHDFTETEEGLKCLQNSKYVQSQIGVNYKKAKSFLDQGRWVLFTGTHCQIAGLKQFLRKDYENLLAVDIFCHGVPSNKTWQQYLKELKNKNQSENILSINFRSKKEEGWGRYHVNIELDNKKISQLYRKNTFQRGFIKNLYLRPSCYECAFKQSNSGADISLGDFWGISNSVPSLDDDKGTSKVVVYTQKGSQILKALDIITHETTKANNAPILWDSAYVNDERNAFFASNKVSFHELVSNLCKDNLKNRIKVFISDLLISCIGFKTRKKIKNLIKNRI